MKLLPLALIAALAVSVARAETIDLGAGATLDLVAIEPGTFVQGSPAEEPGRGDDESHRTVHLTRAFLIGKSPVTRGQFARFVAATRYRTEAESGPSGGFGWDGAQLTQRREFTWRNPGFPQTDEHPVTIVSYNDAQAFLKWLSRTTRRTFTLPSEAQWEYAARAGAAAAPAAESAWHNGNSGNATHPVGEKAANVWGLQDAIGNVWEWCEDWYAPYAGGEVSDPLQRASNLSDKPRRVLRGGSWLRDPKFCRPAARYRNDPLSRNADNGFRVITMALEAVPAAPAVQLERPIETARTPVEDAAPAPIPTTHTTRAVAAGASVLWMLVFAIPVLLFGLVILVAVLKRFAKPLSAVSGGRGMASIGGSGRLRTRIVDDGFWIQGDSLARGATLACRYTNGMGTQSTQVPYEPGAGGQFVFTGSRPSNVSVSVIGAAGGSSMVDDFSNDTPFTRHPPAY